MRIKHFFYLVKGWIKNTYSYNLMLPHDGNYDSYWKLRNLSKETQLNSFQKKRAELVLKYIKSESEWVDVACGDGGILLYVNEKKHMKSMVGTEISSSASEIALNRGVSMLNVDLMKQADLESLPEADFYSMFEILEHLKNSEEILKIALRKSRMGVFLSVPNTGFFTHRIRLMLGKFPMQWRHDPSEHLRFWTVSDMNWWLNSLCIYDYQIHVYEGVPMLNKLLPSVFGQGIFVYIRKT